MRRRSKGKDNKARCKPKKSYPRKMRHGTDKQRKMHEVYKMGRKKEEERPMGDETRGGGRAREGKCCWPLLVGAGSICFLSPPNTTTINRTFFFSFFLFLGCPKLDRVLDIDSDLHCNPISSHDSAKPFFLPR